MGVYSPHKPSPGFRGPGYGRFRFPKHKVVKWNCVFRLRDDKNGIALGDYTFRNFVIVGSLNDVVLTMRKLHEMFGGSRGQPIRGPR